jgi:hypothetical protein
METWVPLSYVIQQSTDLELDKRFVSRRNNIDTLRPEDILLQGQDECIYTILLLFPFFLNRVGSSVGTSHLFLASPFQQLLKMTQWIGFIPE